MALQWILISVVVLGLCIVIPIKIYAADEQKRTLVNWLVLIPISLIILFYVYPVGIQFFQDMATRQ
jgi:hypothetical protein